MKSALESTLRPELEQYQKDIEVGQYVGIRAVPCAEVLDVVDDRFLTVKVGSKPRLVARSNVLVVYKTLEEWRGA